MSTSPLPPCPPSSPQPARSGSNIVAIALLVLALIVSLSGIAIWTGLRFLSHSLRVQVEHREGGNKEVSINTPVGSIEVHHEVDEDSLSLPIYPGATRVKDKDTAAVNFGFAGEAGAHVLVAKFETADPLERVKAFYTQRLAGEVTKFTEHGSYGETSFEIKTHNLIKVVALESAGSRTSIKLVRVSFGKSETN